MPRQVNYNGVIHNFPDDASDDEIRLSLNKHDITPSAGTLDYKNALDRSTEYNRRADSFKKNIGKNLVDTFPAAGAMLAGPESGFLLSGAGAAAGSAVKQGLQKTFPNAFGQGPSNLGDAALETGKDTLLSGLIPTGIGKVLKSVPTLAKKIVTSANPAIKDWINANLSKYITPSADVIESAASKARSNVPLGQTQQNVPGGQVELPENIQNLLKVRGGYTSIPRAEIANKALSSISEARNFKLATGEPQTLEQLGTNKVISKGFSGDGGVDPNKILDEMKGEVYQEAISPQTRQNITDFMNKVKEIQPDPVKGIMNNIINYSKKRIMFDLPAAIGGHMLGGGTGGLVSVVLTETALTQLARNPIVGRLAIKALETPASAVEAPFIQKALVQALRGSSVLIQNKDGETEKAVIGADGRVQYPR